MKHVGIYSGTFDPVHEGHILFASTVMDQYGLDEVRIMPEKEPRRKEGVTSLVHREAMIKVALQDYPKISLLSSAEHDSHSVIDTLAFVIEQYEEARFSLIMGADVFENIGLWDDYEELRGTINIIVGLRTEDDGEIVLPLAKELELNAAFLPVPLAGISSSKIRRAIQDELQPKGLNDGVEDYVRSNSLYTI